MYFSRFTQKSKKVIELSLECAREFGHNRVDSEHLLLGLSKEGDGVASRVLLKLGITPKYIEGNREKRYYTYNANRFSTKP